MDLNALTCEPYDQPLPLTNPTNAVMNGFEVRPATCNEKQAATHNVYFFSLEPLALSDPWLSSRHWRRRLSSDLVRGETLAEGVEWRERHVVMVPSHGMFT
jgi:hypothetical protein